MEGGDNAIEDRAYVTTTAQSPGDTLRIQVDMITDDVGGGGGGTVGQSSLDGNVSSWCIQGDRGSDDVAMVAKRLHCLDDIGNREDFHRQCCEVSCCTAKEVIQIMRCRSYKVSLLRIASEIFLLQDLLNPTHYNCTEELLDSWLSVQEDKDQGSSAILDNVNKMVALVESVEHLVIFLRSLLKRFGTRFLGLCTDLALRALKQQRHLVVTDGSRVDDVTSRKKLAQTVDLVGQMYLGKRGQMYPSCLLSSLYTDPSDQRYYALEGYFTKSQDTTAAVNVDSFPVDIDAYTDLLHTINMLRPVDLDSELDWSRLKTLVIDVLHRAGYHYDPLSDAFNCNVKVKSEWSQMESVASVNDDSDFKMHSSAAEANGDTATSDWQSWYGNIPAAVEQKTWNCDEVSSLNTDERYTFYRNVKVENVADAAGNDLSLDAVKQNGADCGLLISQNELPDSTSSDVAGVSSHNENINVKELEYHGSNGSVDSSGVDTSGDIKKWKSLPSSEDECSNPLNIASAEEEDTGSIKEDVEAFGSPSAFSKKRSASAEMVSLSQVTAEPSRKRRIVSIGRSKSLRKSECEDTVCVSSDKPSEVSRCKWSLRTKDRFERNRGHVTRRTFLFKYTFPVKHQPKDTGKRSVSESDSGSSLSEPNVTVPNGIKLKNCFIKLHRVETDVEQNRAEEDEKTEECIQETVSDTLQNEVEANEKETPDKDIVKEPTEDKVVQCVCDGCGMVVPDCSWLTAHIVTCTGRPECGVSDVLSEEELAEGFQPDAPIWDPDPVGSNSSANENVMDVVVPAVEVGAEGGIGGILAIDSGDDVAAFAPQNATDVDASNLMHILENQVNTSSSSSFIYDPVISARLKVIQMTDGTSFSVSNRPTIRNDISDEQYGKEVFYNGVYMYEFVEYQCDACLLTFASHSAAADHVQSSDHSRSTISRNSFCCCLKCSIRYREKHIMWHHILYMCGNAVEDAVDESRLYRCPQCCKAFLSAAFLRRHVFLQHGRQCTGTTTQQQHNIGVVPQLSQTTCPPSVLATNPSAVPRLSDFRVGIDGQLLGTWNCFQVNETGTNIAAGTQGDRNVNVFPMPAQESTETDLKQFSQKVKTGDRDMTGVSESNGVTVTGESGADSQALLDLACSIVLGGCSPPATNFADNSVNSSHPTSAAGAAAAATTATTPAPSANSTNQSSTGHASSRRTAKGIMYKNVFMQCIVNYLCSTCKKDLSTKASKKEHKSSPCFDADSKRFTYLRQYSYLCPYCSEKFPSQKFCRQHQLSVCLQLMGVKTDELNHKQLLCPFCDRKYFNIITLKGHMTLIHKVNKLESSQILGTTGLLDELIGYAPDGLTEKAKEAKKQTILEEERKHAEAKKRSAAKENAPKKAVGSVKDASPSDKKSECELKAESGVEVAEADNATTQQNKSGESLIAQTSDQADVENGASHDSRLESNVAEATHLEPDGAGNLTIKEETDQPELCIVKNVEVDGLAFDADVSNDVSTDDLSDLDDLSCETDNTLPANDPKESQFNDTEETLDGKKSLKRKKSKKTRKKIVTKCRKKSH